jgi:peptidoglycan/LPS O-acetylase OafA/YrhL
MLRNSKSTYPQYAIRRTARLYFPYIIAIITALILRNTLVHQGIADIPKSHLWSSSLSVYQILDHLTFVTNFDTSMVDFVIWTLVQEMRISLIFPLIMLAVNKYGWKTNMVFFGIMGILANIVIVYSHALVPDGWAGSLINYSSTVHYCFFFVIGALLERYSTNLWNFYRSLSRVRKLALGLMSLVIYTYAGRFFAAKGVVSLLTNDWPSFPAIVIIILFVLFSSRLSILLQLKPIRFLGKISYSLYLYHPIILLAAIYALYGKIHLFVILCIAFPVTLIVSTLSYVYVEEPSRKIGKELSARLAGSFRIHPL